MKQVPYWIAPRTADPAERAQESLLLAGKHGSGVRKAGLGYLDPVYATGFSAVSPDYLRPLGGTTCRQGTRCLAVAITS